VSCSVETIIESAYVNYWVAFVILLWWFVALYSCCQYAAFLCSVCTHTVLCQEISYYCHCVNFSCCLLWLAAKSMISYHFPHQVIHVLDILSIGFLPTFIAPSAAYKLMLLLLVCTIKTMLNIGIFKKIKGAILPNTKIAP